VNRLRAGLLGLFIALATTVRAGQAFAQDAPVRKQAAFAWDDKQMLRVSVGYRDVFDPTTSAKLTGGLPTTIVMRAYIFRESGGEAIAATYKSCRVIFDLWDEVYKIEISQSGARDSFTVSPSLEGVLRRCAEADKLPVAPRSLVPPPDRYYVAGIVEVNPVSPDMLDRIKRWVSRPSGGTTAAPGDALFGSFVGLFVARIGTADRQLSWRTQLVAP
jgi:hypothetical protein